MPAKAQVEKEKGNAAFKAEKYPEAIGHYSAAIFTDSSDPTLPLNRAAVYLKLGKNVDAERDCSTVLSLKPGHVKALYRRAQARMELQKRTEARQDLIEALKYEPNNAAVKDNLLKLDRIGSPSLNGDEEGFRKTNAPARPRRRRVPIKIVDTPSTVELEHLRPVSSRALSSKGANGTVPALASPSTSQPAEDAPETSTDRKMQEGPSHRQSEQLGGIFRPSGEHTLFQRGSSTNSESNGLVSPRTDARPVTLKMPFAPPYSLFEFLRIWELALPADRWDLLCRVPPEALPSLFKTSLEASVLSQIIDILSLVAEEGVDEVKQRIREYLAWLSRVPRFSTVTLFLSKIEKERIRSLIEAVGAKPWHI